MHVLDVVTIILLLPVVLLLGSSEYASRDRADRVLRQLGAIAGITCRLVMTYDHACVERGIRCERIVRACDGWEGWTGLVGKAETIDRAKRFLAPPLGTIPADCDVAYFCDRKRFKLLHAASKARGDVWDEDFERAIDGLAAESFYAVLLQMRGVSWEEQQAVTPNSDK